MDENRERDESGRYRREHSDADVLDAVRRHEPAGTSDVASELGIARQSADYRLRQLEDREQVTKKKIGRTLAWFVASEE